ncbi:MAG: preprotein translocase subunit YajC [Rickettsiales bacterium]|jgi:preprotein translocase subunit YajC|nr:preprotein translocase subunit YajC [Rickettsiales bacterium]
MENVAASPRGGSTVMMIVWCLLIFGFMYFFMLRPNKKRMDEYKKMLNGLKIGSRIICAGGIYATIREIGEATLKVEIANGVVIEIPKSAVANIA